MGFNLSDLSPALRKQVLAVMAQTRLDPIRGKDVHVPSTSGAGAKNLSSEGKNEDSQVVDYKVSTSGTKSPLEARFLALWQDAGGPELEREVGLIPGRLFRVDFLHRASKTVIECEGFGKGHTSKFSFKKDAEKYFALQVDLGFEVIRLTRDLLTENNIKKIIFHAQWRQRVI